MNTKPSRGFTLLIAVILSTVALTVGLSLLDVSYKQIILAGGAKQSGYAFYNADTAMECALYYDQKLNAFDRIAPLPAASISCGGSPISSYLRNVSGATTTTTFQAANALSSTTVVKTDGTSTCAGTGIFNCFYTSGFNNSAANDTRRVERGLKASY